MNPLKRLLCVHSQSQPHDRRCPKCGRNIARIKEEKRRAQNIRQAQARTSTIRKIFCTHHTVDPHYQYCKICGAYIAPIANWLRNVNRRRERLQNGDKRP